MMDLLANPVALAALAVVVAILAVAIRGVALGYPPPRLRTTRVFSAKEQAIVAACADALFPPGGPIPLSGTEAGVVEYMERYVQWAPRATRVLIRLLIRFIEHSPWLFGPRHARFTRLSHEERCAALDRMARSQVYFHRVSFLSMRTMLSMGYLANPEVSRSIGITSSATPFERIVAPRGAEPVAPREVHA
jgi:hypothetical protein